MHFRSELRVIKIFYNNKYSALFIIRQKVAFSNMWWSRIISVRVSVMWTDISPGAPCSPWHVFSVHFQLDIGRFALKVIKISSYRSQQSSSLWNGALWWKYLLHTRAVYYIPFHKLRRHAMHFRRLHFACLEKLLSLYFPLHSALFLSAAYGYYKTFYCHFKSSRECRRGGR